MESKKMNIILGVVIVILLMVITYMYVDSRDRNDYENLLKQNNRQNVLLDNKNQTKTQEEIKVEDQAKYLTYTNDKYGFTLNLPERWSEYKVEEAKTTFNDVATYYFELKLKDNTYGKPFAISIFTLDAWKKVKNQGGPIPAYRDENSKYVFTSAYAQDDQNYVGFPETQGPIYDAQTIIIPSLKLIDAKETSDNKTYTNQTYKYSFEYPKKDVLRVNSAQRQYLVDKDTISFIKSEKVDEASSLASFMFDKIKLFCDADGTTASISCPRYAVNPVSFKTTTGLTGYKLVFAQKTTTFKPGKTPVVTNANKTVYVVDLSDNSKNKLLLVVEPVDGDLVLAKSIALSVVKY